MEDDLGRLGRRLRAARLRAGFSQGQLHVRSGVPKSRISRYENGHLLPSLQTLRRVASALGTHEGALLSTREAHLDAFCDELRSRGVEFRSEEQARGAADSVADMLLGGRPGRVGPAGQKV